MTVVRVADVVVADEAGFACSKNKLVKDGLLHLRPFNIAEGGGLDLTQQYRIPPTEAPKGKAEILTGDILFNNTNSAELVGKAAVADHSMVAGYSNHLTRIRVDRQRVDPRWFGYWLRSLRATGYFTANATQWVSQAAYRTSDLGKLELRLPALDEQRRIVDLLSRAEGIIRLRREAQAKAQAIIPALFLDMFGDPATNPKGWPVHLLGDLLAESPTLGTMAKPSVAPAGWLDLRVANIQDGQLTLNDKRWLDLTPDQTERFALRDGDLLLARAIGSLDHLGKAVIVHPREPWTFDSHLMRIRVNREILLPEYLKSFLESGSGREEFLKHTRQSAVQFNINGKEIRRIAIPLPPLSLQMRFEEQSHIILDITAQQAEAINKAEATFQALLARAFGSGDYE